MASNTIQKKTIVIEVDAGTAEKSLRTISNSLGRMEKSVKGVKDGFESLKNVFAGAAGASFLGLGVREITNIADGFTQLNSRISVFAGSAEKGAEIFNKLAKNADETKVSVQAMAEVFSRVQVATSRLNIASDAQLGISRILQQSFRLAGTSAQEAASSTIQFTQALASGQLRGQELRSILEGNGVLASIFTKRAEEAGVSVYKFAEAGRFTNKEVLTLLLKNFQDIEEKAGKMSQTFEQSLAIAMNQITIAIGNLNKATGASDLFAKFVDTVIKNGPTVAAILTGLAATTLPAFARGMVLAATSLNPFTLAIGAMGFAAVKSAGSLQEFIGELETLPLIVKNMGARLLRDVAGVFTLGLSKLIPNKPDQDLKDYIIANMEEIEKIRSEYRIVEAEMQGAFRGPPVETDLEKMTNALRESIKNMKDPIKSISEQVGILQSSFNAGTIDVMRFNSQLERLTMVQLNEKLRAGTIDLAKYRKEIRELKLSQITNEFEHGVISVGEFNEKIRLFKIEELNQKFRDGKIAVAEFTNELVKLQNTGLLDKETYTMGIGAGISNYIESIGTLSSQIADATKRAFSSLEDSLLEFTKNGRQDWAQFTQGILDDLTRIAIRTAIVNPLAGGLLDLLTPSAGNMGQGAGRFGQNPIDYNAAGGAFDSNGVKFFAKGGIVDSPTLFGFNRGIGMAGEAGPEAILPLARSADGSLGVKSSSQSLVVNVINNSGAEVSASESVGADGSRTLELVIENKVKEGISRGAFDRSLQQSFGLNRRGI